MCWIPDDETIDDDLDVVTAIAVQPGRIVESEDLPVDANAQVTVSLETFEELVVLSLALLHHGSQDVDAGVSLEGGEATDDLVAGLSADLAAALDAVRRAAAGEQDAEIVVNLGDGADGRTRVLPTGLLGDGDGRGQTSYQLHRKRLDVQFQYLNHKGLSVGSWAGLLYLVD